MNPQERITDEHDSQMPEVVLVALLVEPLLVGLTPAHSVGQRVVKDSRVGLCADLGRADHRQTVLGTDGVCLREAGFGVGEPSRVAIRHVHERSLEVVGCDALRKELGLKRFPGVHDVLERQPPRGAVDPLVDELGAPLGEPREVVALCALALVLDHLDAAVELSQAVEIGSVFGRPIVVYEDEGGNVSERASTAVFLQPGEILNK